MNNATPPVAIDAVPVLTKAIVSLPLLDPTKV